jgi:hypothetical protein
MSNNLNTDNASQPVTFSGGSGLGPDGVPVSGSDSPRFENFVWSGSVVVNPSSSAELRAGGTLILLGATAANYTNNAVDTLVTYSFTPGVPINGQAVTSCGPFVVAP